MDGHPRLEFRLLGPIEVLADGVPLDLRPRLQRAVLAQLALDAGRIVPLDRIIHGLWADDVPASATGRCRPTSPSRAGSSSPAGRREPSRRSC